eukprot:TRINITY_DN7627_c0_g2_i1.p1 TRINITY_DN7627_c0_g2~~TRINITY_DN7627_c0_g2_i1.p1  ORF type:complete len:344 (-),score=91.35 TRINITY_DN7627_c0_g2_i1:138-1169(-)
MAMSIRFQLLALVALAGVVVSLYFLYASPMPLQKRAVREPPGYAAWKKRLAAEAEAQQLLEEQEDAKRGIVVKHPPHIRLNEKIRKIDTAVCISGQIRSLHLVYKNLIRNVFSQLGTRDVFMLLVDNDGSAKAFVSSKEGKAALREMGVTDYRLHKQKPLSTETKGKPYVYKKEGIQGWFQQLDGFRLCNEMRHAYERRTNTEYKWVMRLRPDIACVEPIAPVKSYKRGQAYFTDFQAYTGYNDKIALLPPEGFDTYASQLEYARNFTGTLAPEGFLKTVFETYQPTMEKNLVDFLCATVLPNGVWKNRHTEKFVDVVRKHGEGRAALGGKWASSPQKRKPQT